MSPLSFDIMMSGICFWARTKEAPKFLLVKNKIACCLVSIREIITASENRV